MIARAGLVVLGLLLALPSWAEDLGRFGPVHLTEPQGTPRGLVILFSGSPADDQAAPALAAAGALVIGVDTPGFIARLDATGEACHLAVTDAEAASRQIQRERHWPTYLTPILAGTGLGGAVAAEIRAQAPAATIAGAVAVAPSPAIRSHQPFCAPVPPVAGPNGFVYAPPVEPSGFLAIGAGPLAALVAPHLAPAPASETALADLPLVELPVTNHSDTLAIVLSGDGGWRDIDKSIAEDLQAKGVPVVGWDSLRYFWSRKTPERTGADLALVLDAYTRKWGAKRVILIGYSFGADVLPAAYGLLPAAQRARVVRMSLLALSTAADFEISMSGWLGAPPSAEALPIEPALAAVPHGLVQCYYGTDETDTLCPRLTGQGIAVIKTPGGHHFDGDYAALAQDILTGL